MFKTTYSLTLWLLIAATLPASAAQHPNFRSYTNSEWQAAYSAAKEGQPHFAAESLQAFQALSLYQQEQSTAGRLRHEFTLPSGDHIHCIDVDTQPSLAASPRPFVIAPLEPLGSAEVSRENDRAEENVRRLFGMDGTPDDEGNARQCPAATIPKRIPSLESLLQFRTLDTYLNKHPDGGAVELPTARPPLQALSSTSPHEWAVAYASVENRGGRATFNTWNPFVEKPGEFSLSQLWLIGGSGTGLQTVEAGWQVYPQHYGDKQTRLFIFSTSAGYTDKACYNLECSRFVQTSSAVILGAPVACTSVEDGRQCEIEIEYIRADSATRDWWLKINGVFVGYYPGSLFNAAGIGVRATTIDVGGEIVNLSAQGVHTMTSMGSGRTPSEGYGHAAYIRGIQYIDTGNMLKDATLSTTTPANSSQTAVINGARDPFWGNASIFFGGPGRPLSTTTLRSASASSTMLSAASNFTMAFAIDATLPDDVLLGASLQSTSTIALAANDRKVRLAPGSNSVVRSFAVPAGAAPGSYGLLATLWRDLNGNGVVDSADELLGTLTYPNAITVAATRRHASL